MIFDSDRVRMFAPVKGFKAMLGAENRTITVLKIHVETVYFRFNES